MFRRALFAVSIALLCANLTQVAAVPPKVQFGKIKATVVDVNDSRIVSAKVVIVGGGLRWQVRTNTAGEIELALPAGEYQFFVEADGFRRFDSSKFEIRARKTQRFNVKMYLAPPIGLVPAGPNL